MPLHEDLPDQTWVGEVVSLAQVGGAAQPDRYAAVLGESKSYSQTGRAGR